MRMVALSLLLFAFLTGVAHALSREFLTRTIDLCIDGVAEKHFASMSDTARFVGLTERGARLQFEDPSGTILVHVSLEAKVFRSNCSFALEGAGSVSDAMSEYFADTMRSRSFIKTDTVGGSNQTYVRCDGMVIEATLRRFLKREQATLVFVSRTAGMNECQGE